ncbi:hypothetical protein NH340_JMT06553 [Sarcoptes scabiei]|nr:hypothetical protein NH340_JMT06553 [Sarcoptes scabiei]
MNIILAFRSKSSLFIQTTTNIIIIIITPSYFFFLIFFVLLIDENYKFIKIYEFQKNIKCFSFPTIPPFFLVSIFFADYLYCLLKSSQGQIILEKNILFGTFLGQLR